MTQDAYEALLFAGLCLWALAAWVAYTVWKERTGGDE